MAKPTNTAVGLVLLSAVILVPIISEAQLSSGLTADITGLGNNAINAPINNTSSGDTLDIRDTEARLNGDSETLLRTNSAGVPVVSSSQVNSESDLKVFTSNVPSRKDSVAEIKIDSNNNGAAAVKVVHQYEGKLLGFIPVTVKSTTVVNAKTKTEAEAHLAMPWWSFLVSDKNYTKADLKLRIENSPVVQSKTGINSTPQDKAELTEAVIQEIEASLNAHLLVSD